MYELNKLYLFTNVYCTSILNLHILFPQYAGKRLFIIKAFTFLDVRNIILICKTRWNKFPRAHCKQSAETYKMYVPRDTLVAKHNLKGGLRSDIVR